MVSAQSTAIIMPASLSDHVKHIQILLKFLYMLLSWISSWFYVIDPVSHIMSVALG